MKFPTFSLLALVAGTRAQLSWKEATSGVTFKVGIPEASAAPFDMIVTFEAPATAGWVGWAAGGCMIRNPIVVAWPDGKGGVTASARWADAYHAPHGYDGATAIVSKTESSSNATHWTATILCKGCSKWEGAAVAATGNWTFGWGVSSRPVDNPTNVNASIRFHDVGKSHFEVDMAGARIKDFAAATKGFV